RCPMSSKPKRHDLNLYALKLLLQTSLVGCLYHCRPVKNRETVSKLGVLCGTTLLAARRLGESNVVLYECSVHNGRLHLEHEVCSSRRPAHLLFGRHPTMQKPMDRALGLRRRDWLARTPCGGI